MAKAHSVKSKQNVHFETFRAKNSYTRYLLTIFRPEISNRKDFNKHGELFSEQVGTITRAILYAKFKKTWNAILFL